MNPSLMKLLCSPYDGSPLTLQADKQINGEVISGYLMDRAGNSFPIVDGVPLFAQDRAVDETFSFKWRRIGDSYGHETRTRTTRQNWYLDRFGFETREKLMHFLKTKGLILDAGTGSGVDTAMFADSGGTVVAVDLSQEAALATYRHLGHRENVYVIQADLCELPFSMAVFDFISCDQVLHHTPNAADSFDVLIRHLKQGGHMALYVYKRKGPIREFTDDYLRKYTTQMEAKECYEFCKAITLLGKALSDLKTDVEIPADIPLLDLTAGTEDVQRFFYWNVLKCFWNDDYDLLTNTLINFDWYHPKYASRHTSEEVRGWFAKHDLEIEVLNVVPSGIAILGRRR